MKKAEKLARAARARALLGIGDDDGRENPEARSVHRVVEKVEPRASERTVDRDTGNRVVPGGRRNKKRAARSSASEQASSERQPEPAPEPTFFPEVPSRLVPKRHANGAIKRGDSVWYCNQRYYVEWAPDDWKKGAHVRICNHKVHPDPVRPLPSDHPDKTLVTFCVHADCLELAPMAAKPYQKDPTKADLARVERARAGIKDAGDEVALLLRKAKDLADVYQIGAKYLSMKVDELKAKYGHLNPGQQRMNVGNKMRAFWRKRHA